MSKEEWCDGVFGHFAVNKRIKSRNFGKLKNYVGASFLALSHKLWVKELLANNLKMETES